MHNAGGVLVAVVVGVAGILLSGPWRAVDGSRRLRWASTIIDFGIWTSAVALWLDGILGLSRAAFVCSLTLLARSYFDRWLDRKYPDPRQVDDPERPSFQEEEWARRLGR